MVEPSLRSQRGPARGHYPKRRQVREAIGEAREALQEIWGMAPTTQRPSASLWRWVFCCAAGMRQRVVASRRRIVALGRSLPTLAVALLLVVTMANQGFGLYIASMSTPEGGASAAPMLIPNPGTPSQKEAFDFAPAPITFSRQRAVEEPVALTAPVSITETTPENVLARSEVVTCTVQAGDTLDSIAAQYGVTAYTVFWVNGLHTPEVDPGLVLTIPPLSGVPHTVRVGETLDSVADTYGVRPGNIVGYPPNRLKYPYSLSPGQEVFVPGGIVEIPNYYVEDGERPAPTLVKMPGGEKLGWPTVGEITGPFGWSKAYGGYHNGLDIANAWGTPIYAAADGTVTEAGWGGLGWYVVIDHGNGFSTEYGHMGESPPVSVGDTVARGEHIGLMGRTYGRGGYATGVHLHFGVRHHGVYIDPLPLLEQ